MLNADCKFSFQMERTDINQHSYLRREGPMKNTKAVLILGTFILAMVVSCSSNHQQVQPAALPPAGEKVTPQPYIIQPGDQLDIKFFYNPELNETITVRPDGKISLQLIDEIRAAGRSPAELDEILTERYARELRKPSVTVILRSFSAQRIYVGGEVNRQGLVDLSPRMTPIQAIFEAGGLKETAQPKEAIVIRKGDDNQPIPIRLDLESALYGKGNGADFQLQATDIIYIPMSPIAKANLFVNQYIERLFLFRGVSLGFSYDLNDSDD